MPCLGHSPSFLHLPLTSRLPDYSASHRLHYSYLYNLFCSHRPFSNSSHLEESSIVCQSLRLRPSETFYLDSKSPPSSILLLPTTSTSATPASINPCPYLISNLTTESASLHLPRVSRVCRSSLGVGPALLTPPLPYWSHVSIN